MNNNNSDKFVMIFGIISGVVIIKVKLFDLWNLLKCISIIVVIVLRIVVVVVV